MERIVVFFSQSWISFLALYGWLRTDIFIMAKLIQPISAIALFTLIARYVLQVDDLSYYVIGNALVACWTTAFAGITTMLNTERMRGTLPYLILTPTPRLFLFAGRSFLYLVDGIVTVLLALAVGSLLFGLSYAKANVPAMALSILTGVFSVSCTALMLGSLALITREITLIMNLAISVLTVFAGVNFPISAFPPFLRWVSYITPLTRALSSAREAYHGATLASLTLPLLGETALALLYLIVGYGMFRWAEREARIHATLNLY